MGKRTVFYSNTIQAIVGLILGVLAGIFSNGVSPRAVDQFLWALFFSSILSVAAFVVSGYLPKSTRFWWTFVFCAATSGLISMIF